MGLHPEVVATEAPGWPLRFRPQEIIFLFILFPAMWWLPLLPHICTPWYVFAVQALAQNCVFTPICHRNLWSLNCIAGNDSKCLSALWEGCRNDYFLSLVILGYFRTICWPLIQSPVHRTFPRDLWGKEGKKTFVLSIPIATSKVVLRANVNLSTSV